MNYSFSSITFFDLSISKNPDWHLFSDLYRKPTAGNTILEASSFHPKPLLASIPYGQYIRAKQNCSSDVLFEKEAAVLRASKLEVIQIPF